MDRNCQVSHCLYLSESHQKSPPTYPPSLLPEVTLAEVVGTCRHRTESTQGLCQDELTTAGHFPALLHTTGSLNLLFLEISFSTWQVIFNFASFERALRGHYHPVPKLLSGLELMWEQRARPATQHFTSPDAHTWKPSSIWAGLLRVLYLKSHCQRYPLPRTLKNESTVKVYHRQRT